jgi:hypothetical protein
LRYGDVALLEEGAFDGDPRAFEQREVRLRDFEGPGTRFTDVYDFGDDWHHTIEIEKLLALDVAPKNKEAASTALGPGRLRMLAAFQTTSGS